MSALHICSSDLDSGTIYDGEWNFPHGLQGSYTLRYLSFQSDTFPWIWNGSNELTVRTQETSMSSPVTTVVTFDETVLNPMTDFDTIASTITSTITTQVFSGVLFGGDPGIEFTYNHTTNQMQIQSHYGYSVELMWSDSSIAGVFGSLSSSTLLVTDTVDDTFSFPFASDKIEANPKFIECRMDQSSNFIINSRGSNPNLLISTNDIPYVDQNINIHQKTSVLNISFYRTGNYVSPLPFTEEWDMIFTSF